MARPENKLRAAARVLGDRFFYGDACKRGHGTKRGCKRYTSTGACVECVAHAEKRREPRERKPKGKYYHGYQQQRRHYRQPRCH